MHTGFKFWKVGSRKIFAIQEENRHKPCRKRIVVTDTESDEELPKVKRKRSGSDKVENSQVLKEIKAVRKDLEGLFRLSRGMKLPPGLHRQLCDTFRCQICQSAPIKPPVVFTRCCKRFVGCQVCVDKWYLGEQGMGRSCPLCHCERAYAETTALRGLDDFLTTIAPLLNYDDEAHDVDEEELPSVSFE